MKHKSSEYIPISALDSFEKDGNCPELREMCDPNILNSQATGVGKDQNRAKSQGGSATYLFWYFVGVETGTSYFKFFGGNCLYRT